MMTTWRDYLLNKCHTHTWMIYIPGLPRDLDYPEILGLRVPLPTLVLNDTEDQLFTIAEMRRADRHARRGLREGRRRLTVTKPRSTRARTSSTAPCKTRPSPGSNAGSRRDDRGRGRESGQDN